MSYQRNPPKFVCDIAQSVMQVVTHDGCHGTAFLINRRGFALTARHVIEGQDGVVSVRAVLLDRDGRLKPHGPLRRATVVAEDKDTDAALLQINTSPTRRPLQLGNSDLITCAVPLWRLGVDPAGWARGYCCQEARDSEISPEFKVGMEIWPGGSGGPVFTMAGRVIGLVTKYAGRPPFPPLCFAAPINRIRERLLHRQEVRALLRGQLH